MTLYPPTIAQRLERVIKDAWVALHPGGFEASKLPENAPNPNLTIPIAKVKEFNAHYTKVAEFAAYVCGVPIEKFCDLDMLAYIQRQQKSVSELAQEEREEIDALLVEASKR
jgi:hypothetical protein